ncbi:MAG: DUF1987 domain-containing protein [Desulfobacterales bacterium]|nr:DUF1987 domain-containing protein [Desulfobacterales bacterium]
MRNLLREATEDTPYIFFDCENSIFEIKGISYPEDTTEFYEPVFDWLKEYFSQPDKKDITVNIEIVYFHSGSTKIMLDFFDKLAGEAHNGLKIIVNWIYEKTERDMKEYGEEFQANFKLLAFKFIQKDE